MVQPDAIVSPQLSELNQLRLQFAFKLPARIERLSSTCARLSANRATPTDRQSLISDAHALAGSSGTFGYGALGELARVLELTLQRLYESGAGSSEVAVEAGALIESMALAASQRPTALVELDAVRARAVDEEGKRLVYIVDDDENLGKEIVRRIERFGYSGIAFSNAAEAAKALDETLPIAVLLDADLGGGTHEGAEFARASEPLRDRSVPLVFISVHESWRVRLDALRAGAAAYVTKPIDFPALIELLDKHTKRREAEPIRALVLDDIGELAEHFALVLNDAGMECQAFTDPFAMLDKLAEAKPDLILLDLHMPQCSGFELAEVIRQRNIYEGLPIIFLSQERHLGARLNAMRVGGDEFLLKPISDDHLINAVTICALRFRTLNAMMTRDGLTGLLNQITVKLQLEELLPLAVRRGSPLCFAMLDIDHFKQVNDSFGHPVGDQVLRILSRQLGQGLRRSDMVGRFGGEEFAVILPDTEPADALRVLEKLRQDFAELEHRHGETTFHVTFSGGIACSSDHPHLESLIEAADQALYRAKDAGRNCLLLECDSRADEPLLKPHIQRAASIAQI